MAAKTTQKRSKFTVIEYLHEYFFISYLVSLKNTKKLIFCNFLVLPIFNKKTVKIDLFQKVKSRARIGSDGKTSRNVLFGKKSFFSQLLCKNAK